MSTAALPLAKLLRPIADSLVYLQSTKVHPTWFPFALAPTIHATRISIAYQAKVAGRPLSWPTYLAGYLIMCWGGTTLTHLLLSLPPPPFHSAQLYINYLTPHILLTILFSLNPNLLSPQLLDTFFFPLDALVRTTAITAGLNLLNNPSVNPAFVASPLTHLIIGAVASAGGGLAAATLSTWNQEWSFSTPPVLRRGVGLWGSVDVWGGALVALVYGMSTSHPAFSGFQNSLSSYGLAAFAPGAGTFVLSPLGARALGATVLIVLFGLRVYNVHWRSASPAVAPPRTPGMGDRSRAKKSRLQ
ncbi:hypothetical protein AMATHDRAFT_151781 [Amanita thiersii Skay4041]|uniref:Uncharacterized protein n=1 Tax=Amanita thiersii Skay4041 TaxID=703135 RepID=A0A2A9NBY6_9AGAR|nr:hypothetical protein AMATHDRAFT_151781 [Amanita thiersii Skay4041]